MRGRKKRGRRKNWIEEEIARDIKKKDRGGRMSRI